MLNALVLRKQKRFPTGVWSCPC